MENDSSVPYNIESLKGKELAAFKTKARSFQDTYERTYNTKGDSGQSQALQQQLLSAKLIKENNDNVLSRMNPDQSTREKRLAAFFSGIPQPTENVTVPTRKQPPVTTVLPKPSPKANKNVVPRVPQSKEPATFSNGIMNLNDPLNKGFGLLKNDMNTDVKAMNNSLRNLRLSVNNINRQKNMSINELKMVLNHPGSSEDEIKLATELLKTKRKKRSRYSR